MHIVAIIKSMNEVNFVQCETLDDYNRLIEAIAVDKIACNYFVKSVWIQHVATHNYTPIASPSLYIAQIKENSKG